MYKCILLLLISSCSMAQPAAISEIGGNCSLENLKKNLYYVAGEETQGRLIGTHGDTLVSIFVADYFRANGVTAPYPGNSYFQAVKTNRNEEMTGLSINDKKYSLLDGWSLYPRPSIDFNQVSVLAAGFPSSAALISGLQKLDVNRKLLLLDGKIMLDLFGTGMIDTVETVLQQMGALGILWSGPSVKKRIAQIKEFANIPLYDNNLFARKEMEAGLPEIAVTADRLNELLAADGLRVDSNSVWEKPARKFPFVLKTPVSVHFSIKKIPVEAPNVIGVIPGADTSLSCIVVTAHHDHDGVENNKIYYGAVDNGSGTVALMEMAALMNQAAKKGLLPKRTIVLASVTGEERGLIGSFWYVDHPVIPLSKTHAVINIDMLGRVDTFYSGRRPDSNYAYILVMDSLNRGLRKSLFDANKMVNLKLDTYYEDPKFADRRVKGSDQYAFYLKGIPFVRIDCGFCIDYHKPTDTPDKINYPLLKRQTQLAFYTLWNMANN